MMRMQFSINRHLRQLVTSTGYDFKPINSLSFSTVAVVEMVIFDAYMIYLIGIQLRQISVRKIQISRIVTCNMIVVVYRRDLTLFPHHNINKGHVHRGLTT